MSLPRASKVLLGVGFAFAVFSVGYEMRFLKKTGLEPQDFGVGGKIKEKLPNYGELPPFSLMEKSGRRFTKDDLKGKVFLVSFIFTRCKGPCPMITANVARLQKELNPSVRFLSISVDPEYDTPEVLQAYAAKFNAQPDRWYFVTGSPEEVYQLIRGGFSLAVQKSSKALPGKQVIHTTRLALVDQEAQIRGYYDGTSPEQLGKLKKDLEYLIR